ncbi:helix-turn-helix domain-containing protein [Bradyrhizobium sp. SZCCHNRI3043]|uniref:helix-turn-helix domain-containing protein n=1 Tax=Bradyrhizobium sp. SZCCHNRI3043 TaxID=3057292 RepID=UPI0028ECA519|nr:helix-turn-helix domain-containing protein [Bradyrhizobium sp. SZCCHNRI3043]
MAYSVAEACKLLSIGRTTLYHAIKSGELQIAKIGRRTVIRAEFLRAFVDSLPTKDDAEPSGQ